MTYEDHYGFGKNWQRFLERAYTNERLEAAKQSLAEFVDAEDLHGRSFLDIGCGSGLFSYAAHELGASPVTSLDVDEFSVACCRALHERDGSPGDWAILEGSILDDEFVGRLPEADIVYSWGVLHHTGSMWEAVERAASRIAPGGLFYIALYGPYTGPVNSKRWLAIKRFYNRLPRFGRVLMDWLYIVTWVVFAFVRGRRPFREMREYPSRVRGMSFRTDASDWLGGYPYEWATGDEVASFCTGKLGLKSVKTRIVEGGANNEFLFLRPQMSSEVS